ncbi:hypothetical protein ACFX10_026639 [Malus domestica]
MAQRLFARTRQVESLAAKVTSLKQEIRGLKQENKQLHKLAHSYATNMKRKIDQMQELLEMCPKANHVMILYGHFTC